MDETQSTRGAIIDQTKQEAGQTPVAAEPPHHVKVGWTAREHGSAHTPRVAYTLEAAEDTEQARGPTKDPSY